MKDSKEFDRIDDETFFKWARLFGCDRQEWERLERLTPEQIEAELEDLEGETNGNTR